MNSLYEAANSTAIHRCARLTYNAVHQFRKTTIAMKFSEDKPDEGYFITAYDQEQIVINGRSLRNSFVLAPDAVIEHWSAGSVDELSSDHFDSVLDLSPEIVLLGTGGVLRFPDVAVYAQIINQGIGVEVMDTGAACRTYNILLGEGRRVVAGLIL